MRLDKIFLLTLAIVGLMNSCKKDDTSTSNNNNNSTNDTLKLPIVTTNVVTNISWDSAICGGVVIDDGGSEITSRGVCWSINSDPTIDDSIDSSGSDTGEFTSVIKNLKSNTKYFVRAYATNAKGTSYGAQVQFTTLTLNLKVGNEFQGGIIGYILKPGDNGYSSDSISGYIYMADWLNNRKLSWGCQKTSIDGTSAALGTGKSNTAKILDSCEEFNIAAAYCTELEIDGYSDWFLPSLDELVLICKGMSSFDPRLFWTSTQDDGDTRFARLVQLSLPDKYVRADKWSDVIVFPVRYFSIPK